MAILDDLAKDLGLKPASALDPMVEPRAEPLPFLKPQPAATGPDLDFVVIDVETACHRVSSICQIGIVGFSGGREVLTYETLVDPQDVFSGFNTRLHGISAKHVRGRPTFPRLYETLAGHLGGRITAAHSMFDHGALSASCRLAGVPMIQSRWLDSVKVARHAWPELPTHRLNALAEFLGLDHKHHDALSDARVAGWVIVKAIDHTGIDLESWMARPWRHASRRRPRPQAASSGPLLGEKVAVISSPHDTSLMAEIAAAGGRVMANVGRTTTMLVVAGTRPFSPGLRSTNTFVKAEALAAASGTIVILSADELRDRIAVSTPHADAA